MKTLLKKELISIICSSIGLVFALVFLSACGLILWFFPGNYNILDTGYAVLNPFYRVAAFLLLILTPALTMRLISEEKRNKTLALLYSRPIYPYQIILSKWIASLIFIILILLTTTVYIYTLYTLGNPIGNIDLRIAIVTYFSLFIISALFIISGIFASSLSKNQIVAFVIAILLNFFLFYGCELLSSLFNDASAKTVLLNLSLSYHLDRMQKGIIYLNDIILIAGYIIIIFSFIILYINPKKRILPICITGISCFFIILSISFLTARFDLTKDKRYTLSAYTEQLMHRLPKEKDPDIQINIYLSGDINYGFSRLQTSTLELLENLNEKADNHLSVSVINPLTLDIPKNKLHEYMANLSMPAIQLNEADRDGKVSQRLIYPYAQIIHGQDTLPVSLLKNIPGNSAEENLNTSIEALEFQFVDAIRLLLNKNEQHIAFIEGHGELPRAYVYDAEDALAKYYNVNRGQITNDIAVLNNFKVIIIAGPKEQYSETEKFILDQYLMQGGRILWLIDGANISYKDLTEKGQSPSIKNETNLDDLLFTYGIRINSDFVQDALCTSIPVTSDDGSQYTALPWYYSPILLPSNDHTTTKDIAEVKASFVSSISLTNKSNGVIPKVLLTTANRSHIVKVPEMIDFDTQKIESDPKYFETSYIPVALSLEGSFSSAFTNRLIPEDIIPVSTRILEKSKNTKMVIASSSDIIRNGIESGNEGMQVQPMGYDQLTGKLFGNRDFIVNTVNWLANDDNWMELRNKSRQMNLLDKQLIYTNRNKYVFLNIGIPVILILTVIGTISLYRRRKYSK